MKKNETSTSFHLNLLKIVLANVSQKKKKFNKIFNQTGEASTYISVQQLHNGVG